MIKHQTVEIQAEVDPYDILDEMDNEDIVEYLQTHQEKYIDRKGIDYANINYEELAYAYYHGDFNLEKFLDMLDYKRG
jgi:hypothetical protein